ncbi:MAG TPA: hypothetical protein VMZ91_15620 [Candidatus Paceibacterota bacterium]|nr:hypothetical protein [Candidatus Paceibacterota bacterium]
MAKTELDEIRKKNISRRVFKLRREGKTWSDVADVVNDEFDEELSSVKVENLYDYYVALNEVILNTRDNERREAFKVNEIFDEEMKRMINAIKTKSMKHLKIADDLLVEAYEEKDTKAYFRNLPVAIQLFRSILDQINFLNNRLQKIEINQNNLILNEPQILNIVNKAWKQKERDEEFIIHPGTNTLVPNAKKNKKPKKSEAGV